MSKRTKVAILIGSLVVGGSETDIARTFPLLDRDEFEIVVLEFNHAGPLGPALAEAGVRVISRRTAEQFAAAGSHGGARKALERFAVLRWVVAALCSERPDIIHSVLPHSYVYQMAGAWLARSHAKLVMTRHSLNFYSHEQRLISWLERNWLHRRLDIAIGNSIAILRELAEEGVPKEKLRLVRTGVDVARFARQDRDRQVARAALGLADGAFVLTAVGNLHTYKGHADLIEACGIASAALPDGWALLIGGRDQGGNRARYEGRIGELGLSDHIRLLGEVDDVPRLLHAADVFCQPSHHEGFGIAIAEAMAASLPVIATNVGGIPELVRPLGQADATGWLVPPKSPSALAAALLEAVSDAARLEAMGAAARTRAVEEFSLDASVAAYEAVYREVLS